EIGGVGRPAITVQRGATGRCVDGKTATHTAGNAGAPTGAAAVDRYADGQTQRHDRAGDEAASRGGDPLGGSARAGSGFGAAGDRGSGGDGQHVCLGSGIDLLGGNLSRQGGKRGGEPQ